MTEFEYMTVQNMANRELNVSFPPSDQTNWTRPPLIGEDGKFNLVFDQPTDQRRHYALGKYMNAWSNLELRLKTWLAAIFQFSTEDLTALLNALGMRGILEALRAHAFKDLDETDAKTLEKLLERVKENNTRRNHIAHGFWMLEWHVREKGPKVFATCHIYRTYLPSNADSREAIKNYKNRKERTKYMFSVARIESSAKGLDTLSEELGNFFSGRFHTVGKKLQQPV